MITDTLRLGSWTRTLINGNFLSQLGQQIIRLLDLGSGIRGLVHLEEERGHIGESCRRVLNR